MGSEQDPLEMVSADRTSPPTNDLLFVIVIVLLLTVTEWKNKISREGGIFHMLASRDHAMLLRWRVPSALSLTPCLHRITILSLLVDMSVIR
jgi:hypothetical protein